MNKSIENIHFNHHGLAFFKLLLFFSGLNLLLNNFPGIMPQLSRVGGMLVIIIWMACFKPFSFHMSRAHLLWMGGILVALIGMLFEPLSLIGLAGLVFCLNRLITTTNCRFDVLILSLFIYSLILFAYQHNPYMWYGFQEIAFFVSVKLTRLFGHEMMLSASAMGFPIILTIFSLAVAYIFYQPSLRMRTFLLGMPIIGLVLFLFMQPLLSKMASTVFPEAQHTIFDFQFILLVLLIAGLYPFQIKVEKDLQSRSKNTLNVKALGTTIIILLISGGVLVLHSRDIPKTGAIGFINKGTNFNIPIYSKIYGQRSAGMFGVLPEYLKLRGHSVKRVDSPLTNKSLEPLSTLVLFNPNKYFSGAEKNVIYRFIENGGSLLIAGDHTDVNKIMGPINDILAPTHIKLKFDTALPLISGWENSLEKRNHPITAHLENDYDTGLWVGASLKISPPAFPIIIGTAGWADDGDYANTKRAYLGDYKRSKSEQLGDVVLVAEENYGQGKIIVFGDTSSFQNGIIMHTHSFMDDIFNYLSTRKQGAEYPGVRLILFSIGLVFSFWLVRKMPSAPVFFILIFVIHIPHWVIMNMGLKAAPHKVSVGIKSIYQPALIDVSHIERFTQLASDDESLWGLNMNLLRNRYLSMVLKDLKGLEISPPKLLIVVAPTQKLSPKEMALLHRFMEQGGYILFSVGWEEFAASKTFLKKYGLAVDAVPLGSAEVNHMWGKVKFVEAWPIVSDNPSTQKIVQKWDFPIIVLQPVGKGALVLISDSHFLKSHNIESYKTYKINNILFLKNMMAFLKNKIRNPKMGKNIKQ